MSKLLISVRKMFQLSADQAGPPSVGVVANVYPIGAKERSISPERRRGLRNLVVPFELEKTHLPVDVEAGDYLVEAMLPSGQTVSKEVRVGENETCPVVLETAEPPQSWLSWQHLQEGAVPRTAQSYERRTRAIETSIRPDRARSATSEAIHVGVAAVLVGEYPADSWRAMLPRPEQLDAVLSQGVRSRLRSPDVVRKQRSHSAAPAVESDGVTKHFLFRSDSPAVQGALSTIGTVIPGHWRDHVRLFCETQAGADTYTSCLPIPWHTASGRETDVDVAATFVARGPVRTDSPRLRTLVSVRDAQFATLLGYLGNEDYKAAASIFDVAQQYLAGKENNPFAGAAGAYVLLHALEDVSERRESWMGWIQNLMNRFRKIPDGAVLQAWLTLKTSDDDSSGPDARNLFVEAFRRGIPYYTVGLRMLVDGLTLCHNAAHEDKRTDEEVRTALEITRWFALKTDVRQPFTTVKIGDPSAK